MSKLENLLLQVDKIDRTVGNNSVFKNIFKATDFTNSLTKTISFNIPTLSESMQNALSANNRAIRDIGKIPIFSESIMPKSILPDYTKQFKLAKHITSLVSKNQRRDLLQIGDIIRKIQKNSIYKSFKIGDIFKEAHKYSNYKSFKIGDIFKEAHKYSNYKSFDSNNILQSSLSNYSGLGNIAQRLSNPEILKKIWDIKEYTGNTETIDSDLNVEEIQNDISLLGNVENDRLFINSFINLNKKYGKVFSNLIYTIIFTLLINITYDFVVKPMIYEIISDNNQNQTNKIRQIKQIPATCYELDYSQKRFMTKNDIYIKSHKTMNSKTVARLSLGQIINVIEKKKNWIFCTTTVNGNEYAGWVLTRYTSRFKIK